MATEEERILTISVDYEKAIKSIAEYQSKVDELKQSEKELKQALKDGIITKEQYNQEVASSKIKTQMYNQAIRVMNKEINNSVKSDKGKIDSLRGLRATLSNLTAEYDNLTKAERENAKGREILDKINNVTRELKEAEAATQRYYRNVGNYSSAWNGLGFSIQQVARELPSLTIGFNTFFLAISNNLPILMDELSRARAEYKKFVADGKEAVPVWKQVVRSIFSWQTALVAAVTVLTLYGKDIANWVSSLFGGKKAIDALVEAENALNEARIKGISDSSKEITELQLLYDASQDAKRSMQERQSAVDELQRKYPSYFGNLTDEAILAGKAAESYMNLKDAIIANAKAEAIRDKISELAAKRLDAETKANEQRKKQEEYGAVSNYGTKTTIGNDVWAASRGNAQVIAKESVLYNQATEALAKYNQEISEYDIQMEELAKNLNISDLVTDTTKTTKAITDSYDNELKYRRDMIQLQLEAVKKGTSEELSLRIQLLDAERDLELSNTKLTEEMKLAIIAKYENLKNEATDKAFKEAEERVMKEARMTENEFKQEYDRQRKLAEARLAAVESSSQEELDLKKKLNELMLNEELRQYEDDEEMKAAIREKYRVANLNLDKAYNEQKENDEKKRVESEIAIEKEKRNAMRRLTRDLISFSEEVADSNRALAMASKVIALAQIAIDTGTAISSGIKSAMGVPFPANLAAIATTISTVMANITQAIKTVKGAKFATGGDVSGPGTGTSDSIPAMLSNGESVLTARATSMFAPILSAFNQAGGGVPIQGQQTGNQAMGEDMLARAFAKGLSLLPSPVVSVEEITTVSNRVKAIENISRI